MFGHLSEMRLSETQLQDVEDPQLRRKTDDDVQETTIRQSQSQIQNNNSQHGTGRPHSNPSIPKLGTFQDRKKQVLDSLPRVREGATQFVFSAAPIPPKPQARCCSCCCSPGCGCSWKRIKKFFSRIDRRKVIHSFKAGVALGVTTMIILRKNIYSGIGSNILWAVLTIVMVFECTVGATLIKGLNRGIGTLLAAVLGLVFIKHANTYNEDIVPYIVGSTLFAVATVVSYSRNIPIVKARFDYAAVMFVLTFSLVVVSGFQASLGLQTRTTDQIVWDRIITVLIGCLACLIASICILPIWAGGDLHNLLINNFDDLASAIEDCTKIYFSDSIESETYVKRDSKMYKGLRSDDPIYNHYMSVIVSKQMEETLANFATWEPWHCRYGWRYPWTKCVEVGSLLRHCAFTVSALHGCVVSEVQPSKALRQIFSKPCIQMCYQVVMVLREMANTLKECKKMHRPLDSIMSALDESVFELHASIELLCKADSLSKSKDIKKEDINDATLKQTSAYLRRLQTFATNDTIGHTSGTHEDHDDLYSLLNSEAAEYGLKGLTQYLSVTVMVTLLLEIVSRVKPVLRAMAELENHAGFTKQKQMLTKSTKLRLYRTDKLILQHASANIHPM